MNRLLVLAAVAGLASAAAAAPPTPLVSGLMNPASVCVGPNNTVYVTAVGVFGTDGDGAVYRVANGKAVPVATGLDDPKGIAYSAFAKAFFVADKTKVLRIDPAGKVSVHVPATAFPAPPKSLGDVHVDPESGTVYVSDVGGAVYRVLPKGAKVDVVADAKTVPGLQTPGGLTLDGQSHLLVADAGTGALYRVKLADRSAEKLADGFGGAAGLAWDHFGRLIISDRKGDKLFVIPRPGMKPVLMAEGVHAADLCLAPDGKHVLAADPKAGTVAAVPVKVPGMEVDDSPLPLETAVAFPELKWTGWQPETDDGRPNPLRPIVLTHAGDGTNRVFVATQHGVIHVFPNDQKAAQTKVFLDIRDRVVYSDKTNEEGFLGLAFHPRYKETGEFFVFYTPKGGHAKRNVVARFRVSKDDPDRADPASEEVVFLYDNRPYWNHDGGTVCFGPDGCLYVTHGDGGSANDPYDNAQNLKTPLGKVLRLDIDRKENGKNYAIPKDNPFAGREDALPEVWAYGVRNLWRMSFDRKTGRLWAGEVGQNLWEEINHITRGGNYGWNRRESLHPFGAKGSGPRPEFIDPIWEYHHDVGKSITGGGVYRGPRLPELDGHYLYADYVSGKIWALKYDDAAGRVVANRPIKDKNLPVLSWGEDEKGEMYLLTATPNGRGLHWVVRTK